MNKIIASIVGIALIAPVFAGAASCGDIGVNCSGGNPETVQNYGGYVNAQLPKVVPGSYAADGKSLCPMFFTTPCVDISRTPYYLALHR